MYTTKLTKANSQGVENLSPGPIMVQQPSTRYLMHLASMSGISARYEGLPVIRHKIEYQDCNPCAHA